jgi:hypothetical protein
MIIQFCKIDFNNAHKKIKFVDHFFYSFFTVALVTSLMTITANQSRGECSLNVSTHLGLVGFMIHLQESPNSAD